MLNSAFLRAESGLRGRILTLGELEALASLGLTGLLAFYCTRVAGHETVLAEHRLVLGVDLYQCAGDSQTKGFGLTLVTAAVEVDVDVILLGYVERAQGLLYDILKNRRGEVNGERAFVDGDGTRPFLYDHACYCGLTAAYCINCFHASIISFC